MYKTLVKAILAQGFIILSDFAEFCYKVTDFCHLSHTFPSFFVTFAEISLFFCFLKSRQPA